MVEAQWPLRKDTMPPEVYLPQQLRKNLDFWFPKTAPTRLPEQKQKVFNPKRRFVVCVRCFGARRRRFAHPPSPVPENFCIPKTHFAKGKWEVSILRASTPGHRKNLRPIVAVPDEDGAL